MTFDGRSTPLAVGLRTYSLAEAAPQFPCSERWLAEKIRSGHFNARKVCGHWRMTEADIQYALEQCRNGSRPSADDSRLGLTSRSRRRLQKETASSCAGQGEFPPGCNPTINPPPGETQ
jgi:hypothetical protein